MKKIKHIFFSSIIFYIVIMLFFQFGIKEDLQVIPVTRVTTEKEPGKKVNKVAKVEEKKEAEQEQEREEKVEEIVSTTVKGGFMDSIAYIKTLMEEKERRLSTSILELGNIRLVCENTHTGRCRDALYYFQEDPSTPAEAFVFLKDHLPTDVILQEEFSLDDDRYIYNLKSALFKEKHKKFTFNPEYEGEFHLIFAKNPENKIFVVKAQLNYYMEE